MAAPTTHIVIGWAILRAYLHRRNLTLYSLEGIIAGICAILFGVGIDVDHIIGSPKSFKEDLVVRFKKMIRLQSAGPSKGVEFPISWLHNWPGLILVLISGIILYFLFPRTSLCCFPFILWFIHWVVDRFQRSEESCPYYNSFWYPWNKKKYIRKRGYPIKSRPEIIASMVACALIFLFELSKFLVYVF